MPKRKPEEELEQESSSGGVNVGGPQEPFAKKIRRALNFSIESIMQQSPKATTTPAESISPPIMADHHHHNHNYHHHHHNHHHKREFLGEERSRSPSPFVSSVSSRGEELSSSSPEPSVGSELLSHHDHRQPSNGRPKDSQASMSLAQGPGSGCASSGDARLSQVECHLDNKDMWDKFHSLNTEMIITKTGRRMFPVMKVQFHNLNPNARYAVSMDIVPVDNKRYRYAYHKSCWQVAGKADPSAEPRLYPHPDSPFNGDLLSRQVISFEKVKLTNNEMDKSGHIILNSMHKYQPRVHLIELKAPPTQQTTSKSSQDNHLHHHHQQQQQQQQQQFHRHNNSHHHQHHPQSHNHHNQHQHQQPQPPQLDIEGYRTFVFPETVFTAVTAYQNQLITKMKIDKNPFAKGFRDSSRLSDMDRNDPFDYMGSLGPSGRFVGHPGAPSSMEAAASHMDAYQLLASAANNPWYSAAAVAAAAGGGNPFNPMGACSTAQAAQMQATQMWLAAFSACLNGGTTPGATPIPPLGPLSSASMLPSSGPSPHIPPDQTLGDPNGPDSSGGSSSSSANSSGAGN